MNADSKPGDPADRAADGAFGGVHSHRAGYGDDKLGRLVAWLRAHPTTTLASGEGALLLAEIDRLRDDLHTQADWADWANGEIDRLRAAIERVRALHGQGFTRGCCKTCKGYDSFEVPLPCPTLRALDRDA